MAWSRRTLALLTLPLAVACGTSTTPPGGSGGQTGAGGASGGLTGSGGAAASGGAATGGQPSGGTTGSGGSVSSTGGGPPATGGTASGGGTGAGGASSGGTTGGGGSGGSGSGGGSGFSPCPPAGSPCVVLPLGDSITEGFASSGGGYRVELFHQALQDDKNITFVGSANPNGPNMVDNTPFPRNHEGHGGYTIDTDSGHSGISGSITDNALSDFSPDIVLLMIGTNDIYGNVDVGNAPMRLSNLIDDIVTGAPDTLVVVASAIPIKDNAGADAKIVTYNAGVADVVSEHADAGKHVLFVDNYAAIHDQANWASTLMSDNLHPNDAGYAVLGQSFYDAIQGFLP